MKNIIFVLLIGIFIIVCINMRVFFIDTENTKIAVEDIGTFNGLIEDWEININSDIDFVNSVPLNGFEIDQELALDIGNAVLQSLGGKALLEETEFIVYELKDKNIYVITRVPKDNNILGGDYNVAISKINGTILKIWGGE